MSKEYYDQPGINASTLKYFAGRDFNPAQALYKMRNPMEASQSMALGTAVHSILEHEMKTEEAYEILSEAYKTEKAREPWFNKACTMAANVWETCHDIVANPKALRETAHFRDGFKALIDLEVDGVGVDFKSTRATSFEECVREANKWYLEVQAWHYKMIADFSAFEFIFVSSVEPHQVFHVKCSDKYMEEFARPRWQQALDRYLLYKDQEIPLIESGVMEVPHWYTPDEFSVFDDGE